MREQFIKKNIYRATQDLIRQANRIIAQYQDEGFTLTLRQLHYQFVAHDLYENTHNNYKALGKALTAGRLLGLVDWGAIEDRTRNVVFPNWYRNPVEVIQAAAEGYAENLWRNQPYHVEVWVEKDALMGVVERACSEWRVPYTACRGYTSQSEAYAAGKRFEYYESIGKRCVVLYLGDHDPSGIDMTRDHRRRTAQFARSPDVEIIRLALNYDQVEEYNPPPNFTKEGDTRSSDYREQFGDDCWELDALEPTILMRLIQDAIREKVDSDAWATALAEEEHNKEILQRLLDKWPFVEHVLDDKKGP